MSRVTDFLPRFTERKYADSPVSLPSLSLRNGGPQLRVSSPDPGRSTLITSAPRSARFCAAQGPASTRVRSSTRMCERGRAMGTFRDGAIIIRVVFPQNDFDEILVAVKRVVDFN